MPFQQIQETKIHFVEEGSGPGIVFLGGSSLGTFFWRRVFERVGPGYRKIAVDVRGTGKSDAPRGAYSIHAMAKEVLGLADNIGVKEALLVGHSMGGFVSMQMALSNPDFAKGLVLISTAPSGRPTVLKTNEKAARALSRTRGSIEEIFRALLEVGIGPKLRETDPGAIEAMVAAHLEHPPRGFGFTGQRAAIAGFDARDDLGEIRCPARVIHGEADDIVIAQNGEFLAAKIPRGEFTGLDGIGHFPPVEAPEEVAKGVRDAAGSAFGAYSAL